MKKILCSTGALIGRPNNRDFRLIKKIAPRLNCDGMEFMMYSTWYEQVDEITEELKSIDVDFPVMHCEKQLGEMVGRGDKEEVKKALNRFEINCRMADEIGASKMVLHLWNGEFSDSRFENNAAAYGLLSDISKEYNLELMVENVVCNHDNPMKHWNELALMYSDIHFIFDTKMAAFHEQMDLIYDDEYQWLWKENYIKHLHVNDYAGGYMDWQNLRTLPIGKGKIDFKRFFKFLTEKDYAGDFTVEATAFGKDGAVNYDMLNNCFETIRKYIR